MKISNFARAIFVLLALSGMVACSSSGDMEPEVQESETDAGLSGIDATTREHSNCKVRPRGVQPKLRNVSNALLCKQPCSILILILQNFVRQTVMC